VVEQVRALRTRDKILKATAEAINELASNQAIGMIVRRAGLTPGAVYYHFPSRAAMIRAVIEAQHDASVQRAQRIVDRGYPALEAMLRVSADLMYDIIEDPLTRAGIRLTTEIHLLETPPTRSWNDWIAFNTAMITRARDEQDLKPDIDIPDVAEVLTGSIAGMHILSSLLEDLPGLVHRARVLWRQFVQAHTPSEMIPYWIERTDAVFARVDR
jgi:AcrR family transcriptional regulator